MNTTLNLSPEELDLLDRVLEEAHTEVSTEINTEVVEDSNKLPVNSNALIINENTSRFSAAEWFNKMKEQNIILAGLGGIGSHLAFMLSRVNIEQLTLYDSDIVDMSNMSGQLYSSSDVGCNKTSAIAHFISKYSNFYNYYCYPYNFTYSSSPGKIMICGFDNMASRMVYFNSWKAYLETFPEERKECLFIDGRLAAEEFQVFCIKGTDTYLINKYESKWLFSDDQAEETPCSYKQTSFCANMIASVMTNLLVNFVANLCDPIIERALPFYTEYNAERMYFKTEMQ